MGEGGRDHLKSYLYRKFIWQIKTFHRYLTTESCTKLRNQFNLINKPYEENSSLTILLLHCDQLNVYFDSYFSLL